MSDQCGQGCSSCNQNDCPSQEPQSLIEPSHKDSNIKKVIGIVSGKGGVGKSMVTGLTTITAQRAGYQVGILDADVTGPSIPKMFGVESQTYATEEGIMPKVTPSGIKLMSTNYVLERPSDPVLWRGPIIAGLVKQFWTDVIWGDVDFLFVDMPPGTGDVPLTVFQSLPVDGIIVVASPQELVSMIVEKALKMAEMMDIPVLGTVENMSYFTCPHCGGEIKVFGESHLEKISQSYGLKVLGKIPINPDLAASADKGTIEKVEVPWLKNAEEALASLLPK